MFSVRPENPVEPLTLNVLEVVASVAAELELPWFVAGAMARDILLSSVFGLDAGRATRDVDLAVAVDSWQQYSELRQQLQNTRLFQEAKGVAHRLYYRPQPSDHGYPLDVIPFGGIHGKEQLIACQRCNRSGYVVSPLRRRWKYEPALRFRNENPRSCRLCG